MLALAPLKSVNCCCAPALRRERLAFMLGQSRAVGASTIAARSRIMAAIFPEQSAEAVMGYAIEFEQQQATYLQLGPRKRSACGQLLRVTHGVLLVKLGQHTWLLPAGRVLWLAPELLVCVTALAGARFERVTLAPRWPVAMPTGVVWLTPTPLADALCANLAQWARARDWTGIYGDRLRVLADELAHCATAPLQEDSVQRAWLALQAGDLAPWHADFAALISADRLLAQWQVLTAAAQLRAGQNPETVARAQGFADAATLQSALVQWLGPAA
ncbi:MAG: hypothetical protein ACRCYV_03135 [Aeromonas sp.]